MYKIITIDKISVNENGVLEVVPQKKYFAKIYTSMLGVSWNKEKNCLYYVLPVTSDEEIQLYYERILRSVEIVYGRKLRVHFKTIYQNINKATENAIFSLSQ